MHEEAFGKARRKLLPAMLKEYFPTLMLLMVIGLFIVGAFSSGNQI